MAKNKIAICNKCGKKYPRWRSEDRAVCEAIVSAGKGLKRCCGSIIQAPDSKRISAYKEYVRMLMKHPGGVD